MTLEEKKKLLEIKKAETAIAELDMKISERLEDIERMKIHMQAQQEKLAKLQE